MNPIGSFCADRRFRKPLLLIISSCLKNSFRAEGTPRLGIGSAMACRRNTRSGPRGRGPGHPRAGVLPGNLLGSMTSCQTALLWNDTISPKVWALTTETSGGGEEAHRSWPKGRSKRVRERQSISLQGFAGIRVIRGLVSFTAGTAIPSLGCRIEKPKIASARPCRPKLDGIKAELPKTKETNSQKR